MCDSMLQIFEYQNPEWFRVEACQDADAQTGKAITFKDLKEGKRRLFEVVYDKKATMKDLVCRFNHISNLRQKAMMKLKKFANEMQDGNIGFFFVFFDNKDDRRPFNQFFKEFKKSKLLSSEQK